MYALKVEQGKERILVRHISSGFVPSFQAKPGVRLLVVPGYVFSLVKVARSELVPENEWEIIEKISKRKLNRSGAFIPFYGCGCAGFFVFGAVEKRLESK